MKEQIRTEGVRADVFKLTGLRVLSLGLVAKPASGRGFYFAKSKSSFTNYVEFAASVPAKQIVRGVVLAPDVADLQGHVISADDVMQAAHGFMASTALQLDAHHKDNLSNRQAVVVESRVTQNDAVYSFTEQNGNVRKTHVPAGAWVASVKILDPALWKQIESGQIQGFSPVGFAEIEPAPQVTAQEIGVQKNMNDIQHDAQSYGVTERGPYTEFTRRFSDGKTADEFAEQFESLAAKHSELYGLHEIWQFAIQSGNPTLLPEWLEARYGQMPPWLLARYAEVQAEGRNAARPVRQSDIPALPQPIESEIARLTGAGVDDYSALCQAMDKFADLVGDDNQDAELTPEQKQRVKQLMDSLGVGEKDAIALVLKGQAQDE